MIQAVNIQDVSHLTVEWLWLSGLGRSTREDFGPLVQSSPSCDDIGRDVHGSLPGRVVGLRTNHLDL